MAASSARNPRPARHGEPREVRAEDPDRVGRISFRLPKYRQMFFYRDVAPPAMERGDAWHWSLRLHDAPDSSWAPSHCGVASARSAASGSVCLGSGAASLRGRTGRLSPSPAERSNSRFPGCRTAPRMTRRRTSAIRSAGCSWTQRPRRAVASGTMGRRTPSAARGAAAGSRRILPPSPQAAARERQRGPAVASSVTVSQARCSLSAP
jgi:hypothetical protein